ncbi:DUF1330 domain-containing protein [Pseudomonas sp. BIGb0427]|nr:DUF1330 domain-containing protein [Pseudomonas sp. BIGb0427]QPG61544.1 DUF1330 domain-containing protein [Pseudomonas sp. BIGb0427]
MKACWIAPVEVSDPERYQQYIQRALAALAAFPAMPRSSSPGAKAIKSAQRA